MTRYFRVQPGSFDPHHLLDPALQTSTAWHNPEIVMNGVSACASREELATYLATAGQGIPYGAGGWVLVEMEGEELPIRALDAEYGEVLVRPTRIVRVTDLDSDDEMWELIGAAYEAAQ